MEGTSVTSIEAIWLIALSASVRNAVRNAGADFSRKLTRPIRPIPWGWQKRGSPLRPGSWSRREPLQRRTRKLAASDVLCIARMST